MKEFFLKKLDRAIKFTEKAWLKSYIDMSTELRKTRKNDFEKDLFKWINNSVFGKTVENKRDQRDIKLTATKDRRYYLASEPSYHTIKSFSKIF